MIELGIAAALALVIACLMNGRSFIGSEISENQVRFAEERIEGYLKSHKKGGINA